MALKDLLVHVDQTPDALPRLRLAADLCRRHSCRLTALHVRAADPNDLHQQSTAEFGLVAAADLERNQRQTARSWDEQAQQLQEQLTAIGLEYSVEVEYRRPEGAASFVVPQHARFADLCVLGQDLPSAGTAAGFSSSEAVLFGAGRPVLLVPGGGAYPTLGRRILVAWNSSRASARALNDALPLLERADGVTVLAINPDLYVARYRALPPERIADHIRRHNGSVQLLQRTSINEQQIAATIQDEALQAGADLIVAGAFGHPKLWETLLGGVTHSLLSRMRLPVLMSH